MGQATCINHTAKIMERIIVSLFFMFPFFPLVSSGQEKYSKLFDIDQASNSLFYKEYPGKIENDFSIPDTIYINGKGMPVKCIDLGAFIDRKELKNVRLPRHLEIIGHEAFMGCTNLESIYLPSEVNTIAKDAFIDVSLQSVKVDKNNSYFDSRGDCNAIINSSSNTIVVGSTSTVIPQSVTAIGENAFIGRKNLRHVVFPPTLSTIGKEAFRNCIELREVTFEVQDVSAQGTQTIESGAFAGCTRLEHIVLPPTLKTIGREAFYATGLRSIQIPSSVDTINGALFSMCRHLESVIVASHCKNYDSRKNCNAIIEKKSKTLISGCKNTIIPRGVRKVGQSAFKGIADLVSMHVPEDVREIEESAFYGCENLESIVLPKSLNYLGYCFGGCDKLKQITILSRKPPFISLANPEDYNSVTLYVPKGCRDRYEKSDWNIFGTIVELP